MCIMCGCGEAGNNGDIKSQDMPMMVISDMFGADLDEMGAGGINDRDSESTTTLSGDVVNDAD